MPLQDLATEQAEDAVAVDTDLPGQVQKALASYLAGRLSECENLDRSFGEAAEELVKLVLGGGKRIRPTFAWWGWRAAGGAERGPEAAAVLQAASSLELIQACALVHDDLIDASNTRRGNPTMHRLFSDTHQGSGWLGDRRQFGMAAAVLLGDLALAWADDMLHGSGLSTEALSRALPHWQAMRTEVLAGQYLDVLGQARGDETPGAALRVGELKAASYTVQRPLELGAELAGAGSATKWALRRFGADIGVAFQLRDDLLGVFGDPAVTGKPAGDDLREGKRTLLIAEALDSAHGEGDHEAATFLRGVLGDSRLSEESVERTRQVLIRLGAVRAVEERISELTTTALTALSSADIAEPAATRLAELAVAVTDRNR